MYTIIPTNRLKRELKNYLKKFPALEEDINDLFENLEKGHLVGEDITGLKLKGNKVFKCRVENKSSNKGKSGGFRIIYYLVTFDRGIYPLTIYSKNEIRKLINDYVKNDK